MAGSLLLLILVSVAAKSSGMYCYQNHTISMEFFKEDNFRSKRCKQTTNMEDLACIRIEAVAGGMGLNTGSILFGACIPASQCANMSCDGYQQKFGSGTAPGLFTSHLCNITCCFSDNCNNETVASLKARQEITKIAPVLTTAPPQNGDASTENTALGQTAVTNASSAPEKQEVTSNIRHVTNSKEHRNENHGITRSSNEKLRSTLLVTLSGTATAASTTVDSNRNAASKIRSVLSTKCTLLATAALLIAANFL